MKYYVIEVDHPLKGWTRLATRYRTKKCATGWFKFVRAAWHGLPVRAVKVEATR